MARAGVFNGLRFGARHTPKQQTSSPASTNNRNQCVLNNTPHTSLASTSSLPGPALPAKLVSNLASIATRRAILDLLLSRAWPRAGRVARRVRRRRRARDAGIQRSRLGSPRRMIVSRRSPRSAGVAALWRRSALVGWLWHRSSGIIACRGRRGAVVLCIGLRSVAGLILALLHRLLDSPLDAGFFLSFPAGFRLGRPLDIVLSLRLCRERPLSLVSCRGAGRPDDQGSAEQGTPSWRSKPRPKHGALVSCGRGCVLICLKCFSLCSKRPMWTDPGEKRPRLIYSRFV